MIESLDVECRYTPSEVAHTLFGINLALEIDFDRCGVGQRPHGSSLTPDPEQNKRPRIKKSWDVKLEALFPGDCFRKLAYVVGRNWNLSIVTGDSASQGGAVALMVDAISVVTTALLSTHRQAARSGQMHFDTKSIFCGNGSANVYGLTRVWGRFAARDYITLLQVNERISALCDPFLYWIRQPFGEFGV